MTNRIRVALAALALLGGTVPAALMAQTSTSTGMFGAVMITRRVLTNQSGNLGNINPGTAVNIEFGSATGSGRVDFEYNYPTTVNLSANSVLIGRVGAQATVQLTCGVSEIGSSEIFNLGACTTPFNMPQPVGMATKSLHIGYSIAASETAVLAGGSVSASVVMVLANGV